MTYTTIRDREAILALLADEGFSPEISQDHWTHIEAGVAVLLRDDDSVTVTYSASAGLDEEFRPFVVQLWEETALDLLRTILRHYTGWLEG